MWFEHGAWWSDLTLLPYYSLNYNPSPKYKHVSIPLLHNGPVDIRNHFQDSSKRVNVLMDTGTERLSGIK